MNHNMSKDEKVKCRKDDEKKKERKKKRNEGGIEDIYVCGWVGVR